MRGHQTKIAFRLISFCQYIRLPRLNGILKGSSNVPRVRGDWLENLARDMGK